jgi:hypothetical protein
MANFLPVKAPTACSLLSCCASEAEIDPAANTF